MIRSTAASSLTAHPEGEDLVAGASVPGFGSCPGDSICTFG